MKLKLYPAIAIAGIIVILSLSLRQLLSFDCQVWAEFEDSASEPITAPIPQPKPTVTSVTNTTSVASTSLSNSPTPQKLDNPSLPSASVSSVKNSGSFRVSNRTEYPVRVALLMRSGGVTSEPVHWDFAPEEGSGNGLILSLPDKDLTLKNGDILVVFAQDGSRRYWGPYLVGESHLPLWRKEGKEWQLLIEP